MHRDVEPPGRPVVAEGVAEPAGEHQLALAREVPGERRRRCASPRRSAPAAPRARPAGRRRARRAPRRSRPARSRRAARRSGRVPRSRGSRPRRASARPPARAAARSRRSRSPSRAASQATCAIAVVLAISAASRAGTLTARPCSRAASARLTAPGALLRPGRGDPLGDPRVGRQRMRRRRHRAGLLGALRGALRRHLRLLVPVQEPRHLLERGRSGAGARRARHRLRSRPSRPSRGLRPGTLSAGTRPDPHPARKGLTRRHPASTRSPMTDTMPDRALAAEPLTAEAFAPFGDVIEAAGDELPDQRRHVRPLPRPRPDGVHRRGRPLRHQPRRRPALPAAVRLRRWSSATRSAARPSCR